MHLFWVVGLRYPEGITVLPAIVCVIFYSLYVAVAISSGRNSMKTNSRIILGINKPKFKAEKKRYFQLEKQKENEIRV